jgi:arylsulfatase A-like enzyme/Tfp pilus assembly protein PilF
VLVSVDTLRADRLGCYGYARATPHIDGLAKEGVLFENAATSTPLTLPAHASLFTGRSPLQHGVVDNFGYRLADQEITLAEALEAAGFTTGGFVGSFVLDSRWGMAQGFGTYSDDFDAAGATALESSQRSGDQVMSRALEWIAEQGDRRFFAFIHLYDPHTPYAPPEPYRSRYGPSEKGYYDGEVAFVDDLVGRLVQALKERGLYQDTLLVFVADHGESLGDHGEATHGYFIYDETIRVPLIIKTPGASSGTSARAQVRTIDLLPTILDLAGVAVPSPTEGVSLREILKDPLRDPGHLAYIESHYSRLHFGWATLRGLRTDRYKFIEAPRRELYDLREDPKELKNVIGERSGVGQQLAATVAKLAAEQPPAEASLSVDPETERRLAALGYVTASLAAPASSEGGLADPKDKVGLFNKIMEARIVAQTGDVEGAMALIDSVLRDDPEVMLGYMLLGNFRLERREFAQAEAVFRAALARDNRSVKGVYGLALAYKGLGRLEEAAAGFERILRDLDAGQIRSTYQLAEVRLAQGRPAEAEKLLKEALARQTDTSLSLLLADTLLAQGKTAEALAALEKAEPADRNNPWIALSRGNALLERGDAAAALAAYSRAESIAPKDARVLNAKGNALARLGQTARALEAFKKAVELDPRFAAAQNNLGIALAQLGQRAPAEKAFRQAIENDRSYAQAYNNLGFLYLQAGAVKEAIPLFRRALALKPDYLQARSNLELALQKAASR